MKLEAPKNSNYAAVVVRVPAVVELAGCDNVHGVPVFGTQAITQKSVQPGDLMLWFPAEVQLSDAYAKANNMYRHSELNADPEVKGYIEDNRRVKAVKFRGHRSDALLMPLTSLKFLSDTRDGFAFDALDFISEGDVFDSLRGVEICRKYVPAGLKEARPGAEKTPRLSLKSFPEHLDTDNYWRNSHKIRPEAGPLTVTQKLHGTSGRWGKVLVDRKLSRRERIAKWFGIKVQEREYQLVAGSRRVVKGVGQQVHYYGEDLWTCRGNKIGELIPDGFIVYGEIIGWTPEGRPIQPNYTYNLPKGQNELYVYRVARIDERGLITDLSWPAVKDFCRDRGLKWVPEVDILYFSIDTESLFDDLLDMNFAKEIDWWTEGNLGQIGGWKFAEKPVPLSDPKSPDEGFVVRQDGRELLLLKAKSPLFLRGESRNLDQGKIGIEEEEGVEAA